MDLYDGIETVKNVGAQRKTALNKLNIFTVLDLIEYFQLPKLLNSYFLKPHL